MIRYGREESATSRYGVCDDVRPRSRRLLLTVIIVVVALAALLVALDFGARAFAEAKVASEIQQQGFPKKPNVSIKGFPFLTQVISRDFSDVQISAVQPGPGILPPQHRDLLAQDQQLGILRSRRTREQHHPASQAKEQQVDHPYRHEPAILPGTRRSPLANQQVSHPCAVRAAATRRPPGGKPSSRSQRQPDRRPAPRVSPTTCRWRHTAAAAAGQARLPVRR